MSRRLTQLIRIASTNGVLLGFSVFVVVVVAILIHSSVRMHYSELEWRFLRSGLLDGRVSSNHMIAKLTNQQRVYYDEIRQDEVDLSEHVIRQGMRTNASVLSQRAGQMTAFVERINRLFINGIRFLTGDTPLPTEQDLRALETLGSAFIMEFDNDFQKAILLYDDILAEDINDTRLVDLVRLHRGFCFAMLGKFNAADMEYRKVIAGQRDNDLGVTATLLQQFSMTLEKERQAILKSSADALTRAAKMAQLGQCDITDSIINGIGGLTNDQEAQKNLIRGQCFEHRGKKKQASQAYLTAIAQGASLETAKNANRRLLMIGSQLEGEEKIEVQRISKVLNDVLKDSVFETIVKTAPVEPSSSSLALVAQALSSVSISMDSFPTSLPVQGSSSANMSLPLQSAGLTSQWFENLAFLEKAARANAVSQYVSRVDTAAKVEAPKPVAVVAKPKVDLIAPFGTRVTLQTTQGKVFSGTVVSEPGAMLIRLRTMIGVVGIPRTQLDTTGR